jgi:hypothetical protein
MNIFGPTKEQHDQLAAQLKAERTKSGAKDAEHKAELAAALTKYSGWEREAKRHQRDAEIAHERAAAAEKAAARLQAAFDQLAVQERENWHDFGTKSFYFLSSIVKISTDADPEDPTKSLVVKINGESLDRDIHRTPATVSEVLAIIAMHRKSRHRIVGRSDADDLPSAPLPPRPKEPGYDRGR